MKEELGICRNCREHQVFWDEGYGGDGCVCNSENSGATHLNSCYEYVYEESKLMECPAFIAKLELV